MIKKIVTLLLLTVTFNVLAKQPNFVVILADDAGFEEFGLYKVKKGVARRY